MSQTGSCIHEPLLMTAKRPTDRPQENDALMITVKLTQQKTQLQTHRHRPHTDKEPMKMLSADCQQSMAS